MPGPIRPSEVAELRAKMIPEEVFASFNELIGKDYDGKQATVKQDDVVALVIKKMKASGREIEREEFDKPGYNESYPAKFRFTRKVM